MMAEERKTTSIKIKPSIWEEFKIYCIKQKVEMSEKLEEVIKEVLKNDKKEGSFDRWYCKNCNKRYERNVKIKEIAQCKFCKSRKICYLGQVSR